MAEGKDAYFAGGANFMVGGDAAEFELQGATAALSLDNLNVTGSSKNLVAEGGSLTVNTMQAGADATFEVQGQFTINGRSDIDSGSASTEIDEVKKAAKTAGIDLAKAEFTVSGPKAQLKLGNVATETLVQITAAQLENNAKTTVKVDKAIGDANIELENHGMLYLDFDSGTTITAQNAKDLKTALIDSMGNGILNVGSGSLDIKWDHEDTLTTSWDSVKEFANVQGVTSDKLMSTLIDEVAVGTVITGGQYGAIQTDFAAPTALQVNGNLGLHQARGENGGYFVFSTNAAGEQSAVGVDLTADATLLLDGAGKIGAIGGTTGTELVITQGMHSGAAVGTTEILGAIRGVESVEVGNDTTVTMAAEAGQLELNVMEPIIMHCMFESIEMLSNAMNTLREKCVTGITANREVCRNMVYNSIGLVTALNPYLGYETSTMLAKEALTSGRGVYELVLEHKLMSKEELDTILRPENMVKPRKFLRK